MVAHVLARSPKGHALLDTIGDNALIGRHAHALPGPGHLSSCKLLLAHVPSLLLLLHGSKTRLKLETLTLASLAAFP